jgi:hypothetical protein
VNDEFLKWCTSHRCLIVIMTVLIFLCNSIDLGFYRDLLFFINLFIYVLLGMFELFFFIESRSTLYVNRRLVTCWNNYTIFIYICGFNAFISQILWNLLCFLLHYDYGGFVTRITQRVPLIEQERLSLPKHLSSPQLLFNLKFFVNYL